MKDKLEALRQEMKNALNQTEEDQKPQPDNDREIANLIQEELSAHEQKLPPLTKISSKHVRLLVTDEATGRIHMRTLPIEYLENHNGIILTGENIAAQEVKMVFLSAQAMERVEELRGFGLEKPRCSH